MCSCMSDVFMAETTYTILNLVSYVFLTNGTERNMCECGESEKGTDGKSLNELKSAFSASQKDVWDMASEKKKPLVFSENKFFF